MLSAIFDEEISVEIEDKKALLSKHHIALYDVVAESNLSGSADIDLEKSRRKNAAISFLLPPHTKVEKILCNGKTAFNLLTTQLQQEETKNKQEKIQNPIFIHANSTQIPIFCLPSTSPANPRYSLSAWQPHFDFLK